MKRNRVSNFYSYSIFYTTNVFLFEGDIYLSTHTQVGNNKEETQALLVEHNSFKVW